MIREDWNVAKMALQVIAEQGPGLLVAGVEAQENAAVAPLLKMFGRG